MTDLIGLWMSEAEMLERRAREPLTPEELAEIARSREAAERMGELLRMHGFRRVDDEGCE